MLGVPVATRGVGCLGGGLALVAVGALKHAIANNMMCEERQAQGPRQDPATPLVATGEGNVTGTASQDLRRGDKRRMND
jgi:hypothetical protein